MSSLLNVDDLFDLSKKSIQLNDHLHAVSIKLYKHWLQYIATQLDDNERKNIGDFTSVLQLIENSKQRGTKLEGKIWAQYYRLLPTVQKTLPCWAVTSLSVIFEIFPLIFSMSDPFFPITKPGLEV